MSLLYDFIIVGGRPAGVSLALRLGRGGASVLVLDKASFPSPPEVPSCPILYPKAMSLLDELGFTEDTYASAATKLRGGVVDFEPHFQATMKAPEVFGRDYLYGFDRALFDEILWKGLAGQPNIEARSGFRVQELLRDETGRVVGVSGSGEGGAPEALRARLCVVGADGRHSFVARKAGARVLDDRPQTSTVHFAEWEGLGPLGDRKDPVIHIVTRGRGGSVLFFPSANGRVSIATHVRSDRADTKGDAEGYYMRHLQSYEAVQKRLHGAKRVGPLLGVKQVANRYLEHGGAGWVLVGDAVHHKDPVDGQGVYDALIESKRLAEILLSLKEGKLSWDGALTAYKKALMEETGPMFEATMKRLSRELYEEPPTLLVKTLLRWMMQDPEYHERFFFFLSRAIPPENWLSPGLIARCALRGVRRDLLGR
jgi:flavin-dependent dehydrogenase